jgi:hypothetical protein
MSAGGNWARVDLVLVERGQRGGLDEPFWE